MVEAIDYNKKSFKKITYNSKIINLLNIWHCQF